MNNIFDNQRRNQILGSFEKPVEVKKAYTEGIYADTPANRKLGRVGMSYSAYANKVNGGSIEHGDIGDFKKESEKGQVVYKTKIDNKEVKIFQEGRKRNKYWVIEREGEKFKDGGGNILKFNSPNDAVNRTYAIVEEERSGYSFPSPDYLSFNGVRWVNSDESNTKVGEIHIHKYGKKKPEITLTHRNGYDQENILLKNSEMRKLLSGIAKKEDVSLKLDYTEEDMQFWPKNRNFKSLNLLKYNASTGKISYRREPSSSLYAVKEYEFPVSALDKVLEQFKK